MGLESSEGLTGLDVHDGLLTALLGWSFLDRLAGGWCRTVSERPLHALGFLTPWRSQELRIPEGETWRLLIS